MNVPHPPSPQMVIEILSAIAWPTSIDAWHLGVGGAQLKNGGRSKRQKSATKLGRRRREEGGE